MAARTVSRLAVQYVLLFGFWLLLSGKLEPLYIVLGLIAAGLVTFLTMDLLRPERGSMKTKRGMRFFLLSGWRLFLYLMWLFWNIVQANIQVAYLALHPRRPIQPGLLRFRTRLRSETGHIILANSITLTPGTITVDFREGTYLVHALVPGAARSLLEAHMQTRLEAIFGEKEEPTPEIRWVHEERLGT